MSPYGHPKPTIGTRLKVWAYWLGILVSVATSLALMYVVPWYFDLQGVVGGTVSVLILFGGIYAYVYIAKAVLPATFDHGVQDMGLHRSLVKVEKYLASAKRDSNVAWLTRAEKEIANWSEADRLRSTLDRVREEIAEQRERLNDGEPDQRN